MTRSTITTEDAVAALDVTLTVSDAAERVGCSAVALTQVARHRPAVKAARIRQRQRWEKWRRTFPTARAARLGREQVEAEEAGQQRLFGGDGERER